MTLAAQNVKKHMVTIDLNIKQFFPLQTIHMELDRKRLSTKDNFISWWHMAMSGDISAYHRWEGPTGTYWLDAANHPLKHTTGPPPPKRKSPVPKYQ